MSGIYQNWSADSPGGTNESTAAIREGLARAMSAVSEGQSQAREFLLAYGEQVLPGHSPVRRPGQMGDPPSD